MTDAIEERLRRIKEGVAKSPDLWGLKPCLSETQVQEHEEAFGVALPEAYRAFLLNIGNGGRKPYHQLYSIEESVKYIKPKCLKRLAKPFPFKESCKIEDFGEFERLYIKDSLNLPSSLRICNYGCGIEFLLILSGEARGEIWLNDAANSERLFALYDADGVKYDFLSWHEQYMRAGDVLREEE